MLPGPDTVLQEGDIVRVLSTTEDIPAIERALAAAPPTE